MSYEQVVEGLEWAQNAGADLTGKLHLIAKLDSSGDVVVAAAGTDSMIGVIREENISGKPVTVQFGGIAKVKAGGTITPGARITSDGNGAAVATTSAADKVLGVALHAADANDMVAVMLIPGHVAAS